MSKTVVDMPKVTQMIDAGWVVTLFKGGASGYVAHAEHKNIAVWRRAKERTLEQTIRCNDCPDGLDEASLRQINDDDFCEEGVIDTDDFTPEQALTRLAYKVHGEIL